MPFLREVAGAPLLIKEYLPEIPYWPQLSLRGRQDHFVNRFLKPLVKTGLLTDDGDKVFFDRIHHLTAAVSKKLREKGAAAT